MQTTLSHLPHALQVAAGNDRFAEQRGLGISQLDFKLSAKDNSGIFIVENTFHERGGPARHLHHEQEEWFYALYLNRWVQPDSIIPDPYNPLDWDRYQYVHSNPVNYNDPTGHDVGCTGYDAKRCEGSYNNLSKQLEKRKYTITPVVQYIYNEIMTNSKSDYVKNLLNNNLHQGLLGKTVALEEWAVKVGPSQDWDHKPKIQKNEEDAGRDVNYQQAGTKEYHFDIWSNIHYGYVGTEAGFSKDILLDGAGLAQALDDIRKRKSLSPDPTVKGFRAYDQSEDRESIQIGIDLQIQYHDDFQPEDIIWAIEHSTSLDTRE